MSTEIVIANTDDDIISCFPAFSVLRPHIAQADFLPQIRRQQSQGYQILALREQGEVKTVAGFRRTEFLAWGDIIYVDDLSTLPEARSQGYAAQLLYWLIDYARNQGCKGLHLDSGYARHAAHRLYLNHGLQLSSHHFSLEFVTS